VRTPLPNSIKRTAAATIVGLAGRVLDRGRNEREESPNVKVNVSESKGDHHVRVVEVLLDKVEQLESRVTDASLSAHSRRDSREAQTLTEGAGI